MAQNLMRGDGFGVVLLLYWVLLVLLLSCGRAGSEPTRDKQALIAFLSQVPHGRRLVWNESESACGWVGVGCDPTNSSVYFLRLPGVGLIGRIPPNTLGRLTQLRVLSLRANRLDGEIPPDFSQLKLLRSLYLQNNRIAGDFPASIADMGGITRLDLSSNNFTGSIPFSVGNLTSLTGLFLENNGFTGKIPSGVPPKLVDFSVANNRLNGSIPTGYAKFPAAAFANNVDLCGDPLPSCNPFFPVPSPSPTSPPTTIPHKKHKKLSTAAIIGISVAGGVVILLLILAVIFLLLRRRRTKERSKTPKPPITTAAMAVGEAGTSSSRDDVSGVPLAQPSKLVFIPGGGYSFDLEDLLRASAEVLGKGSVGTSYKAVLEEGTVVVVKRLKDVVYTKKEFEELMQNLGNVKHQNLLQLRAFYYSRDEKLLVYDYLPAGSLSALLHGKAFVVQIFAFGDTLNKKRSLSNDYATSPIELGWVGGRLGSRGSGRPPLDWDSRLKIALCAARGIAHLHASGNVVHGNIKSSNILLKQDNLDASVSDFGLNPLFSSSTPPSHRIMGYRAPEVLETRRVTTKSDVYSFGVLLLELLTGKAPNQASLGEEGIDLPRWVQSVVREEWTAEVFDIELMRYQNVEEEMVQLLQIGMACVTTVPDQRPSMQEVLKMIEEINRGDPDDGMQQSSDDALRGGSDGQTPPTDSRASPPGITP
ncbi:putative inactive receptor kinase [Dorcoceras hygrometricum]|uniref:Putative inactive receptor kinase n=1 Tax=Dorcoceras hygrometricum TaxID=472368 RepID=A0A2Z7BPB4_9LAMI|nr:putative inactive receptor kinase [Dorcoceras hygrometricum]